MFVEYNNGGITIAKSKWDQVQPKMHLVEKWARHGP